MVKVPIKLMNHSQHSLELVVKKQKICVHPKNHIKSACFLSTKHS